MSNQNYDPIEGQQELLEKYLDGLLDQKQSAEFLDSVRNDPVISSQIKLQSSIDDAMRRGYSLSSSDAQSIQEKVGSMFSSAATTVEHPDRTNTQTSSPEYAASNPLFKMALAACLLVAIGIGVWNMSSNAPVGAHFEPEPLALLYNETLDQGFRPYYHCEDMPRFADTFESRQGVRLTLGQMPDDTRMLGLSYLGGISRDTTAMLGKVGEEEVMVFVDVVENRDQVLENRVPGLNSFVEEKHGLVFVEVSPLETARMIQHFELEK